MRFHKFAIVLFSLCLLPVTQGFAVQVHRPPGLADVVAVVEHFSTEKALKAERDGRDGLVFYRVDTTGPRGPLTFEVDPESGTVLDVSPAFISRRIASQSLKPGNVPADRARGMAEAIRAAQAQTGGEALEAEYIRNSGSGGHYNVSVLADDIVKVVAIGSNDDTNGESAPGGTPPQPAEHRK